MPSHKTVILRVSDRTYTALLRAAARENVDMELLAERAVEAAFDADGHPRPSTAAELSAPNVNDPATASEIDRLSKLARTLR